MSIEPAHITWLPQNGPAANDGGSGSSDPSRRAELRGRQALTVPEIKLASALSETPSAEQQIQIPAVTIMGDAREVPGIVTTSPFDQTDWQGRGTGGRPGEGDGTGSGPGQGSGPGGPGGEAYQAGNGVASPRLIKETKPAYTAEAMRARIQGTVILEAIVLPDGSVGRVRIVRSLDSTFGLDEEAVTAVRSWRFLPGTLAGRAVPVPVNIELAFTVR